MSSEVKEITVDEVKVALTPDDNEQLNNIVQDAINATANAHQKYIDALEQRLKDKDAEIEKWKKNCDELYEQMSERQKAEVKIAKRMGKVEGIKEFAEKLLDAYEIWTDNDEVEYKYVEELVDKTKKEMIGDV